MFLTFTYQEDIDWRAVLGRPHAMRIVCTRRVSVTTVPEPNYIMLFWRPPHVNKVRFVELDSSDLRGLSPRVEDLYLMTRSDIYWAQLAKAADGYTSIPPCRYHG